MEPGVRFSRGQLHSGIDVAEYLDGLAINYPRSVQGVITGGASKAHARSAVPPTPEMRRAVQAKVSPACIENRASGSS
jgi:hypothetical protein